MPNNFDLSLFRLFNSLVGKNHLVDLFLIFCAEYILHVIGLGVVIFIAWSFLPRQKSSRKYNLFFVFYALLSASVSRFFITELIRLFYYRPRPFVVFPAMVQLVAHDTAGSFPSGHATFLFALATAVFFRYRKTGILLFLAAFLVGVGRVATGLHWPTDIVGGALIGILTAVSLRYGLKEVLKKSGSF